MVRGPINSFTSANIFIIRQRPQKNMSNNTSNESHFTFTETHFKFYFKVLS